MSSAEVKSKKRPALVVEEAVMAKYARGPIKFRASTAPRLKALRKTLAEQEERIESAAFNTALTEVLLPAEQGFIQLEDSSKVYKLKQKNMTPYLDLNTAKNAFDFQLQQFGAYNINYSRNGRFCIYHILNDLQYLPLGICCSPA